MFSGAGPMCVIAQCHTMLDTVLCCHVQSGARVGVRLTPKLRLSLRLRLRLRGCTVLYHATSYCTALYYTALYCTVMGWDGMTWHGMA